MQFVYTFKGWGSDRPADLSPLAPSFAAIEANPADPTLPSVKAAAERAKPTLEQRVAALEAIVRP